MQDEEAARKEHAFNTPKRISSGQIKRMRESPSEVNAIKFPYTVALTGRRGEEDTGLPLDSVIVDLYQQHNKVECLI